MQPAPEEWVVGSTIAGKFTVLGLRGRGGMGDVLEVEHAFTKRIGALKVLNRECAAQPALVERFIREASAAGRIGSPHIVEMLDAGISPEGLPYIFMELLVGSSLEDLLEERGALPFAEALELALQAAEGLGAAHRAGIIHRDVKPANLFVLHQAAKPLVKVLDFGISKFNLPDPQAPLTVVGSAMGTPLYMSYEQLLSSNSVDLRTDVYALGVVLYECLTARHPFNAETIVALSVSIQRGEFSPVSRLRPDIPKSIDTFFARCLSPIRDQRPSDMAEFASELRAQLNPVAPAKLAAPGPVLADTQLAPETPLAGSAPVTAAAAASNAAASNAATARSASAVPPTERASFTPPLAPAGSEPKGGTQLSKATTGGAASVAIPAAAPAKPKSSAGLIAAMAGAALVIGGGAFILGRSGADSHPAAEASAVGDEHVPGAAPGASALPPSAVGAVPPAAGALPSSAAGAVQGASALSVPVAALVAPSPAVIPVPSPASPNLGVASAAIAAGAPQRSIVEADPVRASAKCARLLERLSLGETLGAADARTYAAACKKKRSP